ncbi:hypothetical protein LguiB_013459 [Lonicera macranthoides]
MDSTRRIRSPCFIEEDDGLASLSDIESGFSGKKFHHKHNLVYRSFCNYSVSPRNSVSGRFLDGRFEENQPHFLDSCFLCNKPLGHNRDIFMYRGDIPFCSEECRQEQIEIDEAKEKNLNLSTSMKSKSLRKKEQRKSTSPNKRYPFYTGAVAAA